MDAEPPAIERIPDPEANSDTQYPTPDAQHDPDTDTQDDTDERMRQLARELPGLGALVEVVREVMEERGDRDVHRNGGESMQVAGDV